MLFHPTLVVTPEVESSKLWWLNICGTCVSLFFFFHKSTQFISTGTGVDTSDHVATLRRLRIRPRNSAECERWLNRISAATCLATSTEIAMFLDSQVRSVLKIRNLLSHEQFEEEIRSNHVGPILLVV